MLELADTSAWTARHRDVTVEFDFDSRVAAGQVAGCPIVTLELLWTARSAADLRELRYVLSALPLLEITPAAWERAFDVWARLADEGQHRRVSRTDLVVAATAELAGVPVCHYDRDFEAIASVTGQPHRPLAPLGTL